MHALFFLIAFRSVFERKLRSGTADRILNSGTVKQRKPHAWSYSLGSLEVMFTKFTRI